MPFVYWQAIILIFEPLPPSMLSLFKLIPSGFLSQQFLHLALLWVFPFLIVFVSLTLLKLFLTTPPFVFVAFIIIFILLLKFSSVLPIFLLILLQQLCQFLLLLEQFLDRPKLVWLFFYPFACSILGLY